MKLNHNFISAVRDDIINSKLNIKSVKKYLIKMHNVPARKAKSTINKWLK